MRVIFGLVAIRWLHWAVCILLHSSQFFRICILPRQEAKEGRDVQLLRSQFSSCLNRFDCAAWLIALFSLFVWFGVTAWNMAGTDKATDISLFSVVATQTQFGHVAIARVVILAFVGICLFLLHRFTACKKHGVLRLLAVALVTSNLMMLAVVGHAGATPGGAGAVHLAVDAIHLATVSVWPGGLVFLVLLLRSTIARPFPDVFLLAARTTRRFSICSRIAVAVLSATGLAISFLVIHHVSELWVTAYGQLLSTKVLVFVGMLAIGARNLLILKHKVRLEARLENAIQQTGAVHALFRNALWEVALVALIILIVAALGITEPP